MAEGISDIDMPGSYEISKELIKRKILIDFRPKAGIRIAPHFYTSDEEIPDAMDILYELLHSIASFLQNDPIKPFRMSSNNKKSKPVKWKKRIQLSTEV